MLLKIDFMITSTNLQKFYNGQKNGTFFGFSSPK